MSECKSNTLSAGAMGALAAATVFAVFTLSAETAKADRWSQFGGSRLAAWDRYDSRHAAREWEVNPPRGFPTLSRANIEPLKAAINSYTAIVKQGGWKTIPMVELRPGRRSDTVALLRRRLEMTGDLQVRSNRPRRYDSYVEAAVRNFQARHGLSPTGVPDKATLLALNVPAKARLRQLRTNLSRLNTLSKSAAKRYVLVNIPAAQIEAVNQDQVVSRHAAVVGKIDRRTPVLRSRIHEINFNPYWHIPASIVRKDLVPKARQYARLGKDVLGTYRIDAYDGRGRKLDPAKINWFSNSVYGYRYRQQPWEDNSMGFVKINFHNKHSVYMHDTPSKSLFGRNFRAHSSGCVRVQNVQQLVSWLLTSNSDWDARRVAHMKATGERKDVRLKQRVPVYFAYLTAWSTQDGVVHFRRDLYRRDGVGVMASAY
ncbi:MAG: L,D-transpeptidase family protein [Hyphomicrobiales bacterium]|nr:L,D-transpeptidase family protein [Hyphomicrobiales bacterium]